MGKTTKTRKKPYNVKLSVISRDSEHSGILATLGREIKGYGSMYNGWEEGHSKLKLIEDLWGKRQITKTPVPGVDLETSEEEIQKNPWFREQIRSKIGFGYFSGRVGEIAQLHVDAYDELVDTIVNGEMNRTFRIIKKTYDQFLDYCDHVGLHIYAKGVFDEVVKVTPKNGQTKVMHPPAEPNSALDLFFRSLKCAGKMKAIGFVIEKVEERSEHELVRHDEETDTYKRFSDLRDKIGVWMNHEDTEKEMDRLGLKLYSHVVPLKEAKS